MCQVHGYSLLRTQLNKEYFRDLFDEAVRFSIEIEGHRECSYSLLNCTKLVDTETGPGVFETALAYKPVIQMADNAILFKYMAKSVGMKYRVLPSFMAKPWGNVSISL